MKDDSPLHDPSAHVDVTLVKVLSREIARDGGASLVVDLKDYDPSIPRLLRKSSVSNKKLLTFLEKYPNVFRVDRHSLPHYVYLIVDDDDNNNNMDSSPPIIDTSTEQTSRRAAAVVVVTTKIRYVLQQRNARLRRRHNPADQLPVNISWLVERCARPLHFYLRATDFYRRQPAARLKSPAWYILVLEPFTELLVEHMRPHHVRVEGTKAWLDDDDASPEQQRDNNSTAHRVAQALHEAMRRDGAHHIAYDLLLLRQGTPALLAVVGGHDLLQLYTEDQQQQTMTPEATGAAFRHVRVYREEGASTLYLEDRLATAATQSKAQHHHADRLPHTDTVGRFSVTHGNWARAMTQRMVQLAKTAGTNSTSTMDDDDAVCGRRVCCALDMTASIGGWTNELAQSCTKVVAVELDPYRADCCRKNMLLVHAAAQHVHVVTGDAMDVIAQWGDASSSSSSPVAFTMEPPDVVALDPPWGGPNYKASKAPITLGKWSLCEVVLRVFERFPRTILGIRLPITFQAEPFMKELSQAQRRKGGDTTSMVSSIELRIARKIGPQLFLALGVSFSNQAKN